MVSVGIAGGIEPVGSSGRFRVDVCYEMDHFIWRNIDKRRVICRQVASRCI